MEKFEVQEIAEKDFKGVRAMEAWARSLIMEAVKDAIVEKFGEENVTVTGDTSIAIGFADVELEKAVTEGERTFSRTEWCFELSPTLKPYVGKTTEKRSVDRFDRFAVSDIYADKLEKRKEKAEKKEKKIEKSQNK